MKKNKLIWVILAFTFIGTMEVSSKQIINIDAPESRENVKKVRAARMSTEVERIRPFTYNPSLWNLSLANLGDTLQLNFFEDVSYKAVIKNTSVGYKKSLNISAEIVNHPHSYCAITLKDNDISLYTDIIDENKFTIGKIEGKYYITQTPASAIKNYSICDNEKLGITKHTQEEQNFFNELKKSRSTRLHDDDGEWMVQYDCMTATEDDPAIINVMIGYTQKAENLVTNAWDLSDIETEILSSIAYANNAMANSQAGITFNLVHLFKTDYNEEPYLSFEQTLYSLQDGSNGLDEIAGLREKHKAQLVHLMTSHNYGGYGFMPFSGPDKEGNPNTGFSISGAYVGCYDKVTIVHEMGHNLGCGHNKDQKTNPGGGREEYAGGWHGLKGGADGQGICTVMSYAGYEYDIYKRFYHIPYFSSPNLQYEGITIGDALYADNLRMLKEMKHYIARYSNLQIKFYKFTMDNRFYKEYGDPEPDIPLYQIISGELIDGDRVVAKRGEGEDAGSYFVSGGIFRGDEDVTCEYNPILIEGYLKIKTKSLDKLVNDTVANYTGSPIPLLNLENLPMDARPTITYKGINGTSYSESQIAPTELGEYEVHVIHAKNNNVVAIDKTVTMKIVNDIVGVNSEKNIGIRIKNNILRSNEKIEIDFNKLLNNSELTIRDLSGKQILQTAINNQHIEIDAPSVSGVYILNILSNSKQVFESKIIVK